MCDVYSSVHHCLPFLQLWVVCQWIMSIFYLPQDIVYSLKHAQASDEGLFDATALSRYTPQAVCYASLAFC